MKARQFNPYMADANAAWAGRVLNMEVNPEKGPDLINWNFNMELKFTLVEPLGRTDYPRAWTVMEHQMSYGEQKSTLWGLGTYKLNRTIGSIRTWQLKELEEFVTERELYIVNWDWMKRYPAHETRGETELSKWENTFRYPKLNDLVGRVKHTYEVEKGKVHITKGVNKSPITISILAVPI